MHFGQQKTTYTGLSFLDPKNSTSLYIEGFANKDV